MVGPKLFVLTEFDCFWFPYKNCSWFQIFLIDVTQNAGNSKNEQIGQCKRFEKKVFK